MFILKSDYINIGVPPEILQFVSVDKNGYIQHPPDAVIGEDGVTTLRQLVEELTDANQFFEDKENKDYVWEPINTES